MSHDLLVQMAYFYPSGETQKKEIFTSTVEALISDYGGKKWSQLELVVYENGSEYIFFSIQNFYIRQKISQRRKREMVRA